MSEMIPHAADWIACTRNVLSHPRRRPLVAVGGRAAGRTTRVLPDGCMDLIWLGDVGLVVAGPDTQAHVVPGPAGAYVGLRFAPGWGPAVFGIPASELRDRREPLAVVDGAPDARALAERIAEAPDRAAVLEDFAARRLRGGSPDPVAAAAARRLRGGVGVAEVARDLGLSDRQLHRRSVAAFGYGPKCSPASWPPPGPRPRVRGQPVRRRRGRRRLRRPGAPVARGQSPGRAVARRTRRRLKPVQSVASRSTLCPSGSSTTAYR
ncbi:DUF6597 domain-containing transcriptional factor [Yinghuangia aomiensis]